MKFLIQANIPTESGNLMIQDPNLLSKLERYTRKVKAEATYFFEAHGNLGRLCMRFFNEIPNEQILDGMWPLPPVQRVE